MYTSESGPRCLAEKTLNEDLMNLMYGFTAGTARDIQPSMHVASLGSVVPEVDSCYLQYAVVKSYYPDHAMNMRRSRVNALHLGVSQGYLYLTYIRLGSVKIGTNRPRACFSFSRRGCGIHSGDEGPPEPTV